MKTKKGREAMRKFLEAARDSGDKGVQPWDFGALVVGKAKRHGLVELANGERPDGASYWLTAEGRRYLEAN